MIWKGKKAELITFIKEINEKRKTIKFDFQTKPMIAFKRSQNLQEIAGGHRQNGKSKPCSSTRSSLFCAQIVNTQTFMSREEKSLVYFII